MATTNNTTNPNTKPKVKPKAKAKAKSTTNPIVGAVKDGVVTFLWVMCVSCIGAATWLATSALGLQGFPLAGLAITVLLIFILVFTFGMISDILGGAGFNPTATAAFYALGHGNHTLLSMALRFPAQALGALVGAVTISELMPLKYRGTLGGPFLKVDPHVGAAVEGVLTFSITMAVMWIIIKGPKSPVVKTAMISVATVSHVLVGAGYTGPAMNPANAFGWAYLKNKHNTWEQFYVYWICPFIGAILAGWAFRALFLRPSPVKAKKA